MLSDKSLISWLEEGEKSQQIDNHTEVLKLGPVQHFCKTT
jgi:hypothetical protein